MNQINSNETPELENHETENSLDVGVADLEKIGCREIRKTVEGANTISECLDAKGNRIRIVEHPVHGLKFTVSITPASLGVAQLTNAETKEGVLKIIANYDPKAIEIAQTIRRRTFGNPLRHEASSQDA